MKLVIAEKPSAGRAFAAALGVDKRTNGYLEGKGYLISWCFGHLAELASADAYDEKYSKWSYTDLPILPSAWQYAVSRDKKHQFELLCSLMARADVEEIINACDAGREGELIFRTVYQLSGCAKPVKRLWLSSMEDDAIREGFTALQPSSKYDLLYTSALCRAKADWLVGINATRMFSVLYHRTLHVGRVVSPTLALLVNREKEIRAFQPEPYYTVLLDFGTFSASSGRYKSRTEAERIAGLCRNTELTVYNIDQKTHSEKAPALYDLTALQREANRILGYTAQQTLDYLQALYEKKLCTYPRTDSRFLTDDMGRTVEAAALVSSSICNLDMPGSVMAEQVCNSHKVSDHHAILPTLYAGETDLSPLPAGEREILYLLARRVLCAVSPDYQYTETLIHIGCEDIYFTAKGRTVLHSGWKAYDTQEPENKRLPENLENLKLQAKTVSIQEGTTVPPKHLTEDTLLAYMERAGSEGTPVEAERKGLGTPATRAAVLEKLVAAGYVERKQEKSTTHLIPTQTGMAFISILPEQLCSPLLTAEWEYRLKQVERGELTQDTFMADIAVLVQQLLETYEVLPDVEFQFPSSRNVVGKCPRCGRNVTESKKGYFCESNSCRFGLWRDNKFLISKKINLTRNLAASLLDKQRAFISDIYSEKTGSCYDAFLTMEDTGERTVYHIVFDKGNSLE